MIKLIPLVNFTYILHAAVLTICFCQNNAKTIQTLWYEKAAWNMLVKLNSFVSSHPSFRELNQCNFLDNWLQSCSIFSPTSASSYSIRSFMHRFSRILKSHREHLYILLSHPNNSHTHTHTLYSQVREHTCTHMYVHTHTLTNIHSTLSLSHSHTHTLLTNTLTQTLTYFYLHTDTHTHFTNKYANTHVHTHTLTNIHSTLSLTHTHTHTNSLSCF